VQALGIVVDMAHGTAEMVDGVLDASDGVPVWSHSWIREHGGSWQQSGYVARSLSLPSARKVAARGGAVGLWTVRVRGDPAYPVHSVSSYADEIMRMCDLIGPAHVAFGTDMEARGPAPSSLPTRTCARSVTTWPGAAWPMPRCTTSSSATTRASSSRRCRARPAPEGNPMIERTLFNADHDAFRDAFRRFVDKEVAPFHEAWEKQGYVDRELWRKAGANGYLCPTMPEAYGGAGVDKLYSVEQMEELARGGFTGVGFGLHSEIVAPYVLHYGTEDQKQRYLPRLASGEMVGAIAMSEPAAGSDLQGIKSTALRPGRRQLPAQWQQDLHHQRLARRPGDRRSPRPIPAAGAKGTSLLLVEQGMPGFEKGKRLKKLG
jgi:hypothetical protein